MEATNIRIDQDTADGRGRGGFSRRRFLKGTGMLVVGFSIARIAPWEAIASAAQGVVVADYPEFDLTAVDSFLEIHADEASAMKSFVVCAMRWPRKLVYFLFNFESATSM